jgi:hypothetical protein
MFHSFEHSERWEHPDWFGLTSKVGNLIIGSPRTQFTTRTTHLWQCCAWEAPAMQILVQVPPGNGCVYKQQEENLILPGHWPF